MYISNAVKITSLDMIYILKVFCKPFVALSTFIFSERAGNNRSGNLLSLTSFPCYFL